MWKELQLVKQLNTSESHSMTQVQIVDADEQKRKPVEKRHYNSLHRIDERHHCRFCLRNKGERKNPTTGSS